MPTASACSVAAPVWYAEGLRFDCVQCGQCCSGAPGYVWVDEDEIAALAATEGLDDAAFRSRRTREVRGRGISLVEHRGARGADCCYYQGGCTVYALRPRQCRTWPFWRSNLVSPGAWEAAAAGCPGMGHGRLHPADVIASQVRRDGLP